MQEGLSQKLLNFEVRRLSACPEVIPTLAKWFEAEWGSIGDTYEYSVNWLTQAAQSQDKYPIVLVGFSDGKPVATGSIIENQIEERPNYNPWFAYWYVTPENRDRGIGSELDRQLLTVSRTVGLNEVYLCTDTQEAFRVKRGWQLLERMNKWDSELAIMKYLL